METGRLVLRELRQSDWPAVHSCARLPQASRYQVWGLNSQTDTRQFVSEAVNAAQLTPRRRYVYLAECDNEVVGNGELRITDLADRIGEIQYLVHPRRWGRGIATAIARCLVRIAFEEHGLRQVQATAEPRNVASVAVLRKLGMSYVRTDRAARQIADGWADTAHYRLVAADFNAP